MVDCLFIMHILSKGSIVNESKTNHINSALLVTIHELAEVEEPIGDLAVFW